jgi:hypothetical protein
MRNRADVPGVTCSRTPNKLVTYPDVAERAGKRSPPGTHRQSSSGTKKQPKA